MYDRIRQRPEFTEMQKEPKQPTALRQISVVGLQWKHVQGTFQRRYWLLTTLWKVTVIVPSMAGVRLASNFPKIPVVGTKAAPCATSHNCWAEN
jgi:hypothetical protein